MKKEAVIKLGFLPNNLSILKIKNIKWIPYTINEVFIEK